MANALAILYLETETPIPMTCSDATGIEKGQCLTLSDPYTVAATAGANALFGGIAAEEKIANDGKTKIGVYRHGIFIVEAGTTGVTVGLPIKIEANNEFTSTAADNSDAGYIWGKALETASNGEFFLMELGSG